MKKILAIDLGFGDTKCTLLTEDGTITNQFKFPSVIGITKKNEHVADKRIYDFKEHSYYVGENALHLPSENIIDISDYKNLEFYAPVLIYHAIKTLNIVPDMVVSGLSIAHINNSGYFKESISKFECNNESFDFKNVYILPQGAGIKLTIDKYGHNYPVPQKEFLGNSTYVISDIGQNTLDFILVTDGKTSPNLFTAIEREGLMKIGMLLSKKVKELHGRGITLQEAKEILDTGVYRLRGKKHDFKKYINEVKKDYIKNLIGLVETKYGKVIDKCDFLSLNGGGSSIFKSTEDGFIRIPKNKNEYYNSIGYGLFGLDKLKDGIS